MIGIFSYLFNFLYCSVSLSVLPVPPGVNFNTNSFAEILPVPISAGGGDKMIFPLIPFENG